LQVLPLDERSPAWAPTGTYTQNLLSKTGLVCLLAPFVSKGYYANKMATNWSHFVLYEFLLAKRGKKVTDVTVTKFILILF
jgi:hypothetical protein